MPDVTHFVDSFAMSWEAWYTQLQPDWCIETITDDDDTPGMSLTWDPPEDAILLDWREIKKGSQNGFFLLLLTLGWWGLGASSQGKDVLWWWAYALGDLRWVLEFLFSDEEDNMESYKEGDREPQADNTKDSSTGNVPAKRAVPSDADYPVSKRSVTGTI